jgi:hypothetical protein
VDPWQEGFVAYYRNHLSDRDVRVDDMDDEEVYWRALWHYGRRAVLLVQGNQRFDVSERIDPSIRVMQGDALPVVGPPWPERIYSPCAVDHGPGPVDQQGMKLAKYVCCLRYCCTVKGDNAIICAYMGICIACRRPYFAMGVDYCWPKQFE